MNFLKTIAIGMFALMATAANASTLDQIKNATFELYSGTSAICSGQFVSPTEFLTAAHCVDHSASDAVFSVKTQKSGENYTYLLHLNKKDSYLDTASFTLEDKQAAFPYVDVAKSTEVNLNTGDKVVVSGYPGANDELLVQFGTYTGKRNEIAGWVEKSSPHYLVDVNTAPGNSGSGMYEFIDGTWKLVGTLTGGPQYLWVSYFSTVEGINAVL